MEDSHGKQMSYASNSQPQLRAFHTFAKPFLSEAIGDALHHHHQIQSSNPPTIPPFVVADLGCSYGPNPLHYCSFITSELRRQLHSMDPPPQSSSVFQLLYYFSDLPSNDFNSLFASYATHHELCTSTHHMHMHDHVKRNHATRDNGHTTANSVVDHDTIDFRLFAAAMPGSFYTQLFPAGSLNLVVSAFTLHWLSKVPKEVLDPKSGTSNGGNDVHIDPSCGPRTSAATGAAFARQSQRDLATFLRCRATEMATGATLFLLTFSSPNSGDRVEYFQCTMDELVSEGVISGEERDAFHLPVHMLNEEEIRIAVAGFPDEFEVLRMVTHDHWYILPIDEVERLRDDHQLFATFLTKFVGAIYKPLLRKHLGDERAALFMDRYRQVAVRMGPTPFTLQWDLTVTVLRRRPYNHRSLIIA